ncbi:MAG: ATP-dependent DNA helicase RecQ [Cyanobacteria bacterium SID2]|nr:ATP-dependent DNA helicase RecQ [Cyanobacteria bacterium SID2]
MTDWNRVRETFQNVWGYDDFRYPQGEIVKAILQQQDTLVVLPTGGGKSICFQLPALLQNGVTLVVSPLVALMENQVKELLDRSLPAATLHSERSKYEKTATLKALERQQLRLLYLSPETLLSPKVWQILSQPQIVVNGMMLDEAHCLVQWGDTFRPAYRRLGAVRSSLLKTRSPGTQIPIAAFTATADPDAQRTIQDVLQLRSPQQFLQNPYRPNLSLNVRHTCTPRSRKQQLLKFLNQHRQEAGLVYARTRRDCETLAHWLQQQGFATAAYHAGLGSIDRRQLEDRWLEGSLQFVVCTSAFGMGINKPNVRWVLHYQVPALLSEYLQEVGRAGRDGKPSIALALVSEPTGWLDPSDKQRQQFFQNRENAQIRRAKQLSKQLPKSGSLDAVKHEYKDAEIALSLLHSTGRLAWRDPFYYQILDGKSIPNANTDAVKLMAKYFNTRRCRWMFLLEAFGFRKEAKPCGHCDRCKR